MQGREVVIVEAVRTPIGRGHPEKGQYRDVHPNALLGTVFTEVIDRAGIEAEAVEDVITGCVLAYGEQSVQHRPERVASGRAPDRDTRDHDRPASAARPSRRSTSGPR